MPKHEIEVKYALPADMARKLLPPNATPNQIVQGYLPADAFKTHDMKIILKKGVSINIPARLQKSFTELIATNDKSNDMEIRFRTETMPKNGNKNTLCIKGNATHKGALRIEIEFPIDDVTLSHVRKLCPKIIDKDRFTRGNNPTYEIDLYNVPTLPFATIETEFPTIETMESSRLIVDIERMYPINVTANKNFKNRHLGDNPELAVTDFNKLYSSKIKDGKSDYEIMYNHWVNVGDYKNTRRWGDLVRRNPEIYPESDPEHSVMLAWHFLFSSIFSGLSPNDTAHGLEYAITHDMGEGGRNPIGDITFEQQRKQSAAGQMKTAMLKEAIEKREMERLALCLPDNAGRWLNDQTFCYEMQMDKVARAVKAQDKYIGHAAAVARGYTDILTYPAEYSDKIRAGLGDKENRDYYTITAVETFPENMRMHNFQTLLDEQNEKVPTKKIADMRACINFVYNLFKVIEGSRDTISRGITSPAEHTWQTMYMVITYAHQNGNKQMIRDLDKILKYIMMTGIGDMPLDNLPQNVRRKLLPSKSVEKYIKFINSMFAKEQSINDGR